MGGGWGGEEVPATSSPTLFILLLEHCPGEQQAIAQTEVPKGALISLQKEKRP